jgi:hypothetical protein
VAALFCWFAIVLLLASAILFFTSFRRVGGWLLVLFPLSLDVGILLDMAHGIQKLGQAGYNSDERILPVFIALLIITVVAAMRPRWWWLFWICWLLNAIFCAIAVFLTFFWKVFS